MIEITDHVNYIKVNYAPAGENRIIIIFKDQMLWMETGDNYAWVAINFDSKSLTFDMAGVKGKPVKVGAETAETNAELIVLLAELKNS